MQKPFIIRLCRYVTGTAIFIVIIISLLYKEQCILKNCNVQCYYSETGDVLPSAEDPSFSPKEKSIFFHETSCRSGLTVRQACAVEAAARAHPKREIYVLFSAPVTDHELKTSCLTELLQFPNVKFLRVHAAEYSNGTAVQSMLLNNVIHSRFRIQHTADILRILTLNKWGGIYLDTDVIVTRSLENLPPNFVTKESDDEIASAILSFAKDEIGTNITNEVIKEISKESLWPAIDAKAVKEVLRRLCPKVVRSGDFQTKSIKNCKGIIIFDYELFYPQDYVDIDVIFNPAPKTFDLARPYTYRMWDSLSHNRTISRGTVYDLVARAFCPTIHSQYSYEFSAVITTGATPRLRT